MLPFHSRDVHRLAGHSRFRWNRLHLTKALYKISTRHASLVPLISSPNSLTLFRLNSRQNSMWSTTKGHHIDQKIIRFAPAQVAGSGMVDSGQTTITIPGLSVTEADTVQTNITLPLPVIEGSLSSSIGDMSFA
ncbi:hypothetical protein ARMGADRAFT_187619 [Armillaria gallica]|uniref:Uncharacterized protein n=1 Tax=Armillaria gallica TaxID=47427 RepID=A0A2H3D959_ARMGA|nr:hypothetical protein ARMGADRAFT_187619 [Armillaria gallica]